MSRICQECAPLVYDVPRDDSPNAQMDRAEAALWYAMGEAEEALGSSKAAFAWLVHKVWDDLRPEGALTPRRQRISAVLRKLVMERDEHACVQCGATDGLVLDHTLPVVKGGPSDIDNLRVLCDPCNREKRDQ